ncbi:MAG: polysaccharide export protein [Nitrospinae bacterium]|nr:polysaccharide export protein [Nitrospinota bacterium]
MTAPTPLAFADTAGESPAPAAPEGETAAGESAAAQVAGEYRIGVGDALNIMVFGEPEMSVQEALVRGNGKVSYPLLGEVDAAGKTALEVERIIIDRLQEGYLKDPKVTVSIARYRMIYVRGEVNTPGAYPYTEGLTVDRGVTLAGGFSERGDPDKVTLIREDDPDNPLKNVTLQEKVGPGDVIIVGESLF